MVEVNSDLPLVSVIALCYNQELYCIETLDSIINQSYEPVQLIIVDDFSKDQSVSKIDAWLDLHSREAAFIKHRVNKGICRSLNEAMQQAKGKYIQIVSCDDILLPGKLSNQVGLLEDSGEDVGLVFSDAYLIDGAGKLKEYTLRESRGIKSYPSGMVFLDLLRLNFIQINSCLFRTSAMRETGAFDEDLSFEDYDYFLRVARKYRMIYSEEVSIKYRIHASNISKQLSTVYANSYFRLLEKQTGVSSASDKILKIRMLEVLLSKMMNEYQSGRELYERYKSYFHVPAILDFIIRTKFLAVGVFWLPVRYRKQLLSIRNWMMGFNPANSDQ